MIKSSATKKFPAFKNIHIKDKQKTTLNQEVYGNDKNQYKIN